MKPLPIHTLGIDTFLMIDQEILRTIEIIPTIGIEPTQIIEIKDIKTIDHEVTLATDRIIKDLITAIIKIDRTTTHKIEVRTITIDKETTLNHHRGKTHVIQIRETNIEATRQNITDK